MSIDDIEYHRWPPNPSTGGQSAGPRHTGIIAVHVPTGIAVVVISERSQMTDKRLATEKLVQLISLDIELAVARGLNVGDRQVIAKLEADLREAMQTIETARGVIAEFELARVHAFVAGYDAGWDSSGEGKNSEYTSPRYTTAKYEAERSAALAAFVVPVPP